MSIVEKLDFANALLHNVKGQCNTDETCFTDMMEKYHSQKVNLFYLYCISP